MAVGVCVSEEGDETRLRRTLGLLVGGAPGYEQSPIFLVVVVEVTVDAEVAPVAPQLVIGAPQVVEHSSLDPRLTVPPTVVVAVAVQATWQLLTVRRVQEDEDEEEEPDAEEEPNAVDTLTEGVGVSLGLGVGLPPGLSRSALINGFNSLRSSMARSILESTINFLTLPTVSTMHFTKEKSVLKRPSRKRFSS